MKTYRSRVCLRVTIGNVSGLVFYELVEHEDFVVFEGQLFSVEGDVQAFVTLLDLQVQNSMSNRFHCSTLNV